MRFFIFSITSSSVFVSSFSVCFCPFLRLLYLLLPVFCVILLPVFFQPYCTTFLVLLYPILSPLSITFQIILSIFFVGSSFNNFIQTVCPFYVMTLSSQQFFFSSARVNFYQLNLTVFHSILFKQEERRCFRFFLSVQVSFEIISGSVHSPTQTFTGASDIAFVISNICNFVDVFLFIPIHICLCK